MLLARIRVHLANARSARSARTALDTAGRPLIALGSRGEVLWATPQAMALLVEAGRATRRGARPPPAARGGRDAGRGAGAATVHDRSGTFAHLRPEFDHDGMHGDRV